MPTDPVGLLRQGAVVDRRSFVWLRLVLFHVLFLVTANLYRRVCFAQTRRVDPVAFTEKYANERRGVFQVTCTALGMSPLVCYSPYPGPMQKEALEDVVYECDADGTPFQCWRDRCQGHWKAPRYAVTLTQNAPLRDLWRMPVPV